MSTIFSELETTVSENCSIYFRVNSLRESLGETILRLMAKEGIANPKALAEKAKLSAPGVRKIIAGENDVMLDSLVAIAGALNTDVPELLIEAMRVNPDTKAIREHRADRITAKLSTLPPELQTAIESQINALIKTKGASPQIPRALRDDEKRKPSGRAIGRKAS